MKSVLLIFIAFLVICKAAVIKESEKTRKTFYNLKERYFAILDCSLKCEDWDVYLDDVSKSYQECVDAYGNSEAMSVSQYESLISKCENEMKKAMSKTKSKKVKYIGRGDECIYKDYKPIYLDKEYFPDYLHLDKPGRLCNYDKPDFHESLFYINCDGKKMSSSLGSEIDVENGGPDVTQPGAINYYIHFSRQI